VMLREGESEESGHAVARDIMERLGIAQSQLVREAYLDLQ
jgi:adenylate cyclase class IV